MRALARGSRRLVVQIEAEGAVAELRNAQAQELGELAVDPQVAVYPNASAPIRAMPASASFSFASSLRFGTWTSSAIVLLFDAKGRLRSFQSGDVAGRHSGSVGNHQAAYQGVALVRRAARRARVTFESQTARSV